MTHKQIKLHHCHHPYYYVRLSWFYQFLHSYSSPSYVSSIKGAFSKCYVRISFFQHKPISFLHTPLSTLKSDCQTMQFSRNLYSIALQFQQESLPSIRTVRKKGKHRV